jgi:hypothetical protein
MAVREISPFGLCEVDLALTSAVFIKMLGGYER